MSLLILGSKGQGHNDLITENGSWRLTASPLHVQSSNFTYTFPVRVKINLF